MSLNGVKNLNWRILAGMAVYGVYLAFGYFGEKWEYYTAFIFQCVVATMGIGFGTIAWVMLHNKENRRGEIRFFPLRKIDYVEAAVWAHEEMARTGWTYPAGYVDDWKDCTETSQHMADLMRQWIYRTLDPQEGFGLGIETVGYTKESGTGHQIVECYRPEGSLFFDIWPYHPAEIHLSKKEKKSLQWRNF